MTQAPQPDNPLIDAARGRDTAQPPALRYAAALECMEHEGMHKAAAELRRLHSRVQELEAQLAPQSKDCQRPECISRGCFGHCLKKASKA
ncbi:MAG: hypothetical protein LBE51_08685 [Acidovorax sp.]|jgi:hypothetical protein|nr:hypothetical protein [Acidovorax sp.]